MNKNSKLLIIFIVVGILLVILGSSFAYWQWATNSSQSTAVTFTVTSNFSCSADGGGDITSNDKVLVPTTCTDTAHAIQRPVVVNVNTTGSLPVYLNMGIKVNSIGANLAASQNFKYALTTSSNSCTNNVIASGSFNGAEANSVFNLLEDKEYQTSNNNDQYYLYIWLDSAEENNNTMNQPFSLSLTGQCSNQAPSTLLNAISNNAVIDNTSSTYVSASTGVKFNAISSDTNGKGIYIRAGTENDSYPIYYYRGAVTDNNVLFANFCWKIVRTTGTGGIKLIYNGVPSNGTCNNTGAASQLASDSQYNSATNSLADVGYMYGTRYTYLSETMTNISLVYMYATGYDETNHRLVATGAMNFAGTDWATYYNQLSNNHYTCFNTTGECDQVYYIYYTTNSIAYYVTIPSGKTISDMLNEMLTNSSNTNNSTIKTAIDNWYADNMTGYTSYLEDTQFCNDRTIYQLSGWNPNGGSTTSYLYFGPRGRTLSPYTPSLICNTNDAFTVNVENGNGKLTYPVGLLTVDETRLAGGAMDRNTNNTYYLYNGEFWWTASPSYHSNLYANGYYMSAASSAVSTDLGVRYGVRPAVSLKPGTKFSGGDGTASNPYVVQ